MKFDAEIIFF